jgi:hypothetical protein|tara:strand:- start:6793 stop:7407 length:615 start_codon:yes stop_codon:yes gene_type:complete
MSVVLGIGAYLIISFALSGLTGCASPEPGSPEAVALNIEKQIEQKQDTVEKTLEKAPKWFFNVPVSVNAIYTSGTGVSPNLQLAVDKSTLNAKRALADRLKGLVSSKTKLFVKETGQYENTSAVTEGEQAIINLIKEVNVSGYKTKEVLTFQQDRHYRTFVLLEYPIGKLNTVQIETLKKQLERESKTSANTAFKELNRDIQND